MHCLAHRSCLLKTSNRNQKKEGSWKKQPAWDCETTAGHFLAVEGSPPLSSHLRHYSPLPASPSTPEVCFCLSTWNFYSNHGLPTGPCPPEIISGKTRKMHACITVYTLAHAHPPLRPEASVPLYAAHSCSSGPTLSYNLSCCVFRINQIT